MNKTNNKRQVARCGVCAEMKITQRYQRGVTNIEWVRVCDGCAGKIYKRNYRNPRPINQLDLFAK